MQTDGQTEPNVIEKTVEDRVEHQPVTDQKRQVQPLKRVVIEQVQKDQPNQAVIEKTVPVEDQPVQTVPIDIEKQMPSIYGRRLEVGPRPNLSEAIALFALMMAFLILFVF